MSDISKDQLLDNVAPCSLLCYSCPGFVRGIICELSNKLHTYFEGFDEFLNENLPADSKSYLEKFEKFDEHLLRYTKPQCSGCRNNPDPDRRIKGCFILECSKEHGVDFCGECREFPCDKVDTSLFNATVYNRWLRGSERIRQVGIEQFFEEEKNKSHYIDFVKNDS